MIFVPGIDLPVPELVGISVSGSFFYLMVCLYTVWQLKKNPLTILDRR